MNLSTASVETVTSVEVTELRLVSNSLFKRLEIFSRKEGRHFDHVW
jgi:hypothetical protein